MEGELTEEELRRRTQADIPANAQQEALPVAEGANPVSGVLGVLENAVSAIITLDILSDAVGAIPSIAHEGKDVIESIGDALGDVLDLDF